MEGGIFQNVSDWQLLGKNAVDKTVFAEMPFIRPLFSLLGLSFKKYSMSNTRLIEINGSGSGSGSGCGRLEFHCPKSTVLIGSVQTQTKGGGVQKEEKDCWSIQREPIGSENVVLYVSFPRDGTFIVNLYGKESSSQGSYGHLHKVLINVSGSGSGRGGEGEGGEGGVVGGNTGLPVSVNSDALDFGLRVKSHPLSLINHGGENMEPLLVTLKCPEELSMVANLKILTKTNGENKKTEKKINNVTLITRDPDDATLLTVMTKFPKKGNYKLDLFCHPSSSKSNSYGYALSYQVSVHVASTAGGSTFPTIFQMPSIIKYFSILSPPPWQGVLNNGSTIKMSVLCRGHTNSEDEFHDQLKCQVSGTWMESSLIAIGSGKYEIEMECLLNKDGGSKDDTKNVVTLYCKNDKGSWSGVCSWALQ